MGTRASQGGQASVELVAAIPALIGVALLAVQLALVGYGLWSAAVSARTGARAAYVGAPGRPAAIGALPQPLRRGARVRAGEGGITVGLEVPSLVPGLPQLPVEASAGLRAAPGDAGGG